jgi:hypothetical protein
MNKYKLIVTLSHTHMFFDVIADRFATTTNNSTSSGFYSFYLNDKFIGAYPIERTLITQVDEIETNE